MKGFTSREQHDPRSLTPVERHAGVWFKRDDLFEIARVRGGKARACFLIAQDARAGLVTACARQSPQGPIVANVARYLGLPSWIHTPKGSTTPELRAARAAGARRITHIAGYNSVIVARAREHAARQSLTLIPFGMESALAIESTARQTQNLPRKAQRLIVAVGSGMSLAGILWGLAQQHRSIPVVGVVVGADPERRLDRWAPADWRHRVTLVRSPSAYHNPAPVTDRAGLTLDSFYEAKCLDHLEPDDCFWLVGIR